MYAIRSYYAIPHDLVAGVTVDTCHALDMVNIGGDLQIKTTARKPLGTLLSLFIGGAVPLCLKDADVGDTDTSGTVMTAYTIFLGNLFDHQSRITSYNVCYTKLLRTLPVP